MTNPTELPANGVVSKKNPGQTPLPTDVEMSNWKNEEIELQDQLMSMVFESMPKSIDGSTWPKLRLKRLRLRNFCRYSNVEISFEDKNGVLPMSIIVGPNGTGKTTMLNAVQLLMAKYDMYDAERYAALMQRRIRNHWYATKAQLDAGFSVSGVFNDGQNDYEIEITSSAVLRQHPNFIQQRLMHYIFSARFDQELDRFQLKRTQWAKFQELFGAVTGYPIEEDVTPFDQGADRRMAKILEQFVTGFRVKKPHETILHTACSAGERKIAKCFSTIMNKDVPPSIILIDNVTDHVELDRHVPVVENIAKCFSDSQVIATCHSQPVQRNWPKNQIIDMRFLEVDDLVYRQPWRLRLSDDVKDAVAKVRAMEHLPSAEKTEWLSIGRNIIAYLGGHATPPSKIHSPQDYRDMAADYIVNVTKLSCWDMMYTPMPRIRAIG